jgi:hypothetical protein
MLPKPELNFETKPILKCIFCEQNFAAGKKGEDIIPDWFAQFFHEKFGRSHKVVLGTGDSSGNVELEPRTSQTIAAMQFRLKTVCPSCNNGWMAQCEKAASRIVLAVLNEGKLVLNEDERGSIAEWAQLKAILWDALQTDRILTGSFARNYYAGCRPLNVSVVGAQVSVDEFQPNVIIARRQGLYVFDTVNGHSEVDGLRFSLMLGCFMVEVNFCESAPALEISRDSELASIWPPEAEALTCDLPLISYAAMLDRVDLVLSINFT